MQQFKIIIEWFPFWPLIGLMAFNVLVATLCLIGVLVLISAAVS